MYLKGVKDSMLYVSCFKKLKQTAGVESEDVPENVVETVSKETPKWKLPTLPFTSHTSSDTKGNDSQSESTSLMGEEVRVRKIYLFVGQHFGFTTLSCQLFTQEYTTRREKGKRMNE